MPSVSKIGLIVEGDGEADAAPTLLMRSLHHLKRYDVFCGLTQNAGGRAKLTRHNGLEKFVERAYHRGDAAVLVILDADNDCPVTLAKQLAARILAQGARCPTAIVVAHRMYEAWFLACGPALVGRALPGCPAFDETFVVPNGSDEATRGPKAHIEKHLPPSRCYKERQDQKILTGWLDIEMASANSRSFRRFLNAVQQLLVAVKNEERTVTPKI